MGLRNIGELATQSAYVTEVGVIDDPRTLFKKVKIPFTQSQYIYSYDFIVKAGFKVKDIIPYEKMVQYVLLAIIIVVALFYAYLFLTA